MDCTVWNEHHRTRLACRRPGPGAHRDIERGKVPSAARVACIARSACTSLDQNSNKQLEFTPPSSARTKGDDTRYYVYTYLVRIPTFCFDFPFDEMYRRLLFFTLTRYVCTTRAVVLLIVQLYRCLFIRGWWYA